MGLRSFRSAKQAPTNLQATASHVAMSASFEDELGVPSDASLTASSIARLVTASGAATVTISLETCTRPAARCIVVGRQAATADLRIQHGSISRKHALLYYDADSNLILLDLGSKYGTTVNSDRVQGTCTLHDGDSVLFGNVRESVFTVKRDAVEVSGVKGDESGEKVEKAESIAKDLMEKAGEGLSGRAKRQAEIQAMMASLDETPAYKQFDAPVIPDEKEVVRELTPADNVYQTAVRYGAPIANRLTLEAASERRNVTTCLSVDPAGSRFAVGSTDNSLRFFDFGGMDRVQSRSFKTVIPEDGYWPVDCSYSNTGDRILVGTGSVQPIVLDREGETVIKFVRGDMYVTDQSKTSGHTAAVTAVDWHPLERDVVLTASLDGSARIWNLNGKTQFQMLVCDKVFQAKNIKGQRTPVMCICFHSAGREFAMGTACGSIQVWNRFRVSARPERAIFSAHGDSRPISSLTYSFDGSKLASRSVEDSTVKVWNTQRLSRSAEPIVVCVGADTVHERANSAFSPDAKLLCAGIAQLTKDGERRREMGSLNFYDVSCDIGGSTSPLFSLDLNADIGAVIVKWHLKINQIFVGCSNGQIVIFFDPTLSKKGAIIPSGKAGKRVDDLSELLRSRAPKGAAAITGEIITPMYRDDLGSKRKRDEKTEPVTREPERPATGKHKAGSQAAANINFQQFVADQTIGKRKEIAGKDPREALFKYKEGKRFVDRAYEGNKSKLADKTAEQEEDESKQKK